jgi:HSP20 family molecular chaperone IbpA
MTNNEFDKLLNDFFNAEWGKNVSRYQAYSPSKLALEFNGDTLELAYSVIGHEPKDVEVSLTRDKIYIKAKKNTEDKSPANQFVKDIDEAINLSKEYDGTTTFAEIKNGLLLISIDKCEEQKPKKINIKF